jgi:undecaprenyl-diphosphatase
MYHPGMAGPGSQPFPRSHSRTRLARVIDRMRGLGSRLLRSLQDARDRLLARRPKNLRAVVPLVLGAGLALAASFAFFELGRDIRKGDLSAFDDAVLTWVAERRSADWSEFFLSITALGSWPVMSVLTVGTCAATLLAGERRLPATLGLAMLGVPVLNGLFKALYGRERPSVVPHLETVASSSFPSGHTLASVVFFVTLALLCAGHARRRLLRVFLVSGSLALGALVAASRVYLGVHFPSDVMGGGLVGIAWSLSAVVLDRALRGKLA